MYGPSPAGRYGHAVTMGGTKFFVFGGQVDGEFLNDLWSFDLNSRKTGSCFVFFGTNCLYLSCTLIPLSDNPLSDTHNYWDLPFLVRTRTQWELCQPASPEKPAPRTGHICVTYGDRIIVYVTCLYVVQCLVTNSLFSLVLVELMVNTTTMILGPTTSTPDDGPNYSV